MAGLLVACGSGPVDVEAPQPSAAAAEECAVLLAELPDVVADQDRRDVSPEDVLAGAWGDPAIVLRCGVPEPEGLRPSSACFVVNDVGWFAREREDEVVFTTIGRSTNVEMTVPNDYAPEANALPAVAGPIQQATSELRPCV
ncbi:MAG: DUF3515 domain-containing protein [Nocardioidaceae bacterium]